MTSVSSWANSGRRSAGLAHRRAVRILEGLTRGGPAGPSWVSWLSRLAEVVDHSLSALARSDLPEVLVAQMATSYGRDADDLASLRAKRPAGVDARDYGRYLREEHRIRVLDGMEIGAAGPIHAINEAVYKQYVGQDPGTGGRGRLQKIRASRHRAAARVASSRRRFRAMAAARGSSWEPTAIPPSVAELRDLARRAQSAVVGLHVVPDGTVVGAILPDGHFRATLLTGVTSGALQDLDLGPGRVDECL